VSEKRGKVGKGLKTEATLSSSFRLFRSTTRSQAIPTKLGDEEVEEEDDDKGGEGGDLGVLPPHLSAEVEGEGCCRSVSC
jgi:hypothetical protein